MTEIVNTATILVTADASGVEAGLRPAAEAARNAGAAVARVGDGAAGASRSVEAAGRSIVASIQRATIAMESGSRTSAAYFELLAQQKGVNPSMLAPYIAQLKAVEEAQARQAQAATAQQVAQQQAAEGARAQAAAHRELAQVQASRDNFIAGLREQIALFGASTEEVLRYRAAQIGAEQAAEPLIAQLRAMRQAQEQAAQAERDSAEAARQQAAAQREVAQAQASRDAFLAGLREQIALFGRSTEEVLQYRAAQLGASHDASQLILQLQNMRATQEQVAAAARAQAQAQRDAAAIEGRQNSFIADLQQQADAIGRTRIELLELRAAQLGVTTQATPLIQRLREAQHGLDGTGVSAAQTAAALRGVPAQFTDIIVSLQGGQAPLTVLLQQGGQLKDMFGGVGNAARALGGYVLGLVNPYTIAAAAVGTLAIAYEKGHEEAIAFGREIALSGNAAGTSVNQLMEAARAIRESSNSTQGAAAEALGALVDTGAVSARNLQQFANVSLQAERVLGRAVTDTAAEFAALRKAPLEGLQKLGEQYHFVSSAIYAQVKALQDEGRQEEAAALAQSTYADEMEKRSKKVLENMGALQRGWMNVADWAKKGWDAVLDVGRKETPADELRRLNNILGGKESSVARLKTEGYGDSSTTKALEEDIRLLKARRAEIQAGMAEERKAGEDQEKKAKAESLRNQWKSERDVLLTRPQLLDRDLGAERKKGEELGLAEAEIQDRLVVVRRKYNDIYVQGIDTSITALRRRAEVEAAGDQRALARVEAKRGLGMISDDEAINQTAEIELAALDRQKKVLQDQRDLVGQKLNSQREVADIDGQIAVIGQQRRNREKQQENDLMALQQKRAQDSEELYSKGILGATAERDSLLAQVEAQFQANQEIGLSTKQLAELQAARMYATAAQKDQSAADQDSLDGGAKMAALYREQAQALRDLADAKVRGAVRQEAYDKSIQDLSAMVDIFSALDEAAQSAAQGMAKSFGAVGEAIGGMTTALTGYERTQAAIAAQLAEATRNAYGDPTKIARANQAATEASAQAQIKSYGDMASAAKGFFKESTAGYKVMEGVEKAYRATEMAMALTSMAKKIFFKQTEVTANATLNATKLGGEATASAASTALAGTEASAWGITAVVKAIASLPFPLNLAAGAATLAAVVGIGAKMFGGVRGGMSVSEQRQKEQGTGSVLGDSDAKSESIKKAIEAVEKNTYQDLAINTGMLTALRSIDSNIANFASQLVRTIGITDPDVSGLSAGMSGSNIGSAVLTGSGAVLGGLAAGGASLAAMAGGAGAMTSAFASLGAAAGPIGMIAGALIGAIASKIPIISKAMTGIFGGKQSVTDSGITMSPTALSQILASGAKLSSYADIKTSGGWFKSDKYKTETNPLDAAANNQITAVIRSLADSVSIAGDALGLSGDDFTAKLNSFVVDIGEVSLKDLKGDDLQKALEAVFSKLGDDLAQYAVGGLESLQQVGEGYLETLVRVATEYQTVDVVFQSFGKTFGMVGLASLEARDRLVQLAGGLDEFTSQGEYFLTNFFSEAEQAAALRARVDPMLAKYGLSSSGEDASQMFRDFVVALDTTTQAGAEAYTELMSIAPALKTIIDAGQVALDERKDLQDQLDELTMSSTQLRAKERAAIADSNKALWDQVQALKAVKEAASTLLGGVDDAFSVLQKVVQREKDVLQKRIDKETEAVNRLKSLTDSISSTLDSMSVSGSDAIGRQAAQSEIKAALAAVRGGAQLSDAQIKDLGKALSAVSQDSTKQFGSKEDYLFDYLTTRNDIAALGDVTGDQLSTEEASLEELKDQSKSLDDMLAKYQEQIDELKGIGTTGLSIEQAIYGLQTSIGAAMQNSVVAANAAITKAYQDALGRNPDSAGMEFWQGQAAAGAPTSAIVDAIKGSSEATRKTSIEKLYQSVLGRPADSAGLSFYLTSGASLSDISKALKESDEYKKLHPFAIGTNLVPEDMPAFIHKDERIIPAADNRELMRRLASPQGNSEALATALAAMTATANRQQAVIERMAKDMAAMATILKGVSPNGTFIKTKA